MISPRCPVRAARYALYLCHKGAKAQKFTKNFLGILCFCVFVAISFHSVLKFFTGFAIAARNDWKLIVKNAMNKAIIPASGKIHHLISIL
jgi:hypothetical protein